MTVLCLVEQAPGGGLADASRRALTVAADLAASAGGEVAAVLFAPPGEATLAGGPAGDAAGGPAGDAAGGPAAELGAAGVASAWLVRAGNGYAPAAWARGLAELAVSVAAAAVVAAATDRGAEVLAHLGAITGQPVAANCVTARFVSPGLAELTRHRWAGSVLEDATLEASLALLTVAADAVPADAVPAAPVAGGAVAGGAVAGGAVAGGAVAAAAIQPFWLDLDDRDLLVRATESAESPGGASLATARVVVGGGRGVGGPEGFTVLEELAGLLGGVVGVSRVVTSQGWRPHRQQVGQTGTKIAPELYLACGISGAIQHMAGCQGARHIVAVNTDPDAPIMSRADYAIIGDLAEVLPALVAALRARSGTAGGSGGLSPRADTAGGSGGSSPQAGTAGDPGESSPRAGTA